MLKYFKDVAYCVMLAEPDPSVRMNRSLTRSMSMREDLLGESAKISSEKKPPTRRTYSRSDSSNNKLPKFQYSRPEFLQLNSEDGMIVTADHRIRPIILPKERNRLPWNSGYAECRNAGKSLQNEDQAACHEGFAMSSSSGHNNITHNIPWTYFGIFDGHAGTAVAVAAAAQLHHIIGRRLNEIADLLIALEFEFDDVDYDEEELELDQDFVDCSGSPIASGHENKVNPLKEPDLSEEQEDKKVYNHELEEPLKSGNIEPKEGKRNDDEEGVREKNSNSQEPVETKQDQENQYQQPEQQRPKIEQEFSFPNIIDLSRNNITADMLIRGTLEASFWEMDMLIADDKQNYKMAGGCTAICGLFILGKLYICNAGDSRAIVYKNKQVIPMSFDFTPTSERKRILRLGMQRPELMGNIYTHLEFAKSPTRSDVGKQMLYKDAYMTGWSTKTITHDDLLFPLVSGEGKRSRLLGTIGVTRGFGDHELTSQHGSVLIKPFLTPEPQVRVLQIDKDETIGADDVLIIGSDGLWDVTSNEDAGRIVESFDLYPNKEEIILKYRYEAAAHDLVKHSRGQTTHTMRNIWRTHDGRLASMDDIAVFVIPLKKYRDEYLEWRRLRREAALEASRSKKRPTTATAIATKTATTTN